MIAIKSVIRNAILEANTISNFNIGKLPYSPASTYINSSIVIVMKGHIYIHN